MSNYQKHLGATKKILEASTKEQFPYTTSVLGYEFIVHANVFSPKYFKDTEIFAKHLPIEPEEDLLEIGLGTGAISIIAAKRGAGHIVAVDVNPDAVRNCQENIVRHQLQNVVEVRQGSLFDPIRKDELFDTIFWNSPFGFVEKQNISLLEKAVFDPDYKATREFIFQGPTHLKANGRLILGFSSTLGKLSLIKKFCKEANLQLNLLHKEKSKEGYSVYFELFEIRPW